MILLIFCVSNVTHSNRSMENFVKITCLLRNCDAVLWKLILCTLKWMHKKMHCELCARWKVWEWNGFVDRWFQCWCFANTSQTIRIGRPKQNLLERLSYRTHTCHFDNEPSQIENWNLFFQVKCSCNPSHKILLKTDITYWSTKHLLSSLCLCLCVCVVTLKVEICDHAMQQNDAIGWRAYMSRKC